MMISAQSDQTLSVDVHVNEELVAGKWKERYVLETIANVYDLDDFVSDRLEFVYVTHARGGQNRSRG
jgi:hypothetical protein